MFYFMVTFYSSEVKCACKTKVGNYHFNIFYNVYVCRRGLHDMSPKIVCFCLLRAYFFNVFINIFKNCYWEIKKNKLYYFFKSYGVDNQRRYLTFYMDFGENVSVISFCNYYNKLYGNHVICNDISGYPPPLPEWENKPSFMFLMLTDFSTACLSKRVCTADCVQRDR